jgi:hypothetical protein
MSGPGVGNALVAGVEYPLLNPESFAVEKDDSEARLTPVLALSAGWLVSDGSGGLFK